MFLASFPLATRENITMYLTQFPGSTTWTFMHPTLSRLRGLISALPRTHPSLTFRPVIENADLSYLATCDIFPRWFLEHSHQRE